MKYSQHCKCTHATARRPPLGCPRPRELVPGFRAVSRRDVDRNEAVGRPASQRDGRRSASSEAHSLHCTSNQMMESSSSVQTPKRTGMKQMVHIREDNKGAEMTCTPFPGLGPAPSSMGAAPVQHARHQKNEWAANAGEETEEAGLPSAPMKPSHSDHS